MFPDKRFFEVKNEVLTEVEGSESLDSDLLYFFFKNINTDVKDYFCITLVSCNTINIMEYF